MSLADHATAIKSGLALPMLALSLAGCAVVPVPSETYFPQGFGNAPATKRCAPATLDVRLFERADVTLDVSLQEGRDFGGRLRLRGPSRFLESHMKVREYDLATPTTVELEGCMLPRSADGVLECGFKTGIMASEMSVSFPAFEIEASRHELPPIRFLKHNIRSICVLSLEELTQQ